MTGIRSTDGCGDRVSDCSTDRDGCEPLTVDAFLGGAVQLQQPARGYRAGLDAVLLAAAAPVMAGRAERVLDVGAGVGAVGLCLAARVGDADVTLLERDAAMVGYARGNIAANGFATRMRAVEADVTDKVSLRGVQALLPDGGFDHVLANPPYHDVAGGTLPSRAQKAGAQAMRAEDLETWLRFLARMVRSGGTASVIHLAEALPVLLAGFAGRFGGVVVLPIQARPGQEARRVIVSGVKGSRAPMRLLAGFVLHGADGNGFTPEAEVILRRGARLALS